jgi:hypothetical protein
MDNQIAIKFEECFFVFEVERIGDHWVTSLPYKAGILGSNPLYGRNLES